VGMVGDGYEYLSPCSSLVEWRVTLLQWGLATVLRQKQLINN